MSEAATRARLERFYAHYAPEKLSNVDSALERYKGKEDTMFATLTKMYGPEPSLPEPATAAAAASATPRPAAATSAAAAATATPTSASASAPAPPTAAAAAAKSGADARSGAVTTVNNNSSSSNIHNNNDDDDDDDGDADIEDQLRSIVARSGFLCQEHEHKYVQVWLGSLPLQLLTRETTPGKNPVIVSAWGFKHSRKGGLLSGPWKKRFFLVVPPFLYYSDSDQPSCKARGCAYLARSDIKLLPGTDGKDAISIESRVNRRPAALDSTGDAAPYLIAFETARVTEMWKAVLDKVAAAPYNLTTGHIEASHTRDPHGKTMSPPGRGAANANASFGGTSFIVGTDTSGFDWSALGSGAASNNNNINNNSSISSLPHALTTAMQGATIPPSVIAAMQQQQQHLAHLQQQLQQLQMQQHSNSVGSSAATTPAQQLPAATPQPAAASAAAAAFPIDMKDLLARTQRLASERDPAAVTELLFRHVDAFPGDAGVLWRLMLAVEDAPKLQQPTAADGGGAPGASPVPAAASSSSSAVMAANAMQSPVSQAAAAAGAQQHQSSSRSASFDMLLPMTPSRSAAMAIMSGAPLPQQQQQQSGGSANDSVAAALNRSSNRRLVIDHMLSTLPK